MSCAPSTVVYSPSLMADVTHALDGVVLCRGLCRCFTMIRPCITASVLTDPSSSRNRADAGPMLALYAVGSQVAAVVDSDLICER